METISSEGTETKLNELSDVLNKVLQVITKALDDLTVKMVILEEKVYNLDQRLNELQVKIQDKKEQIARNQSALAVAQPAPIASSFQATAGQETNNSAAKEESKQLTPTSARAAVSSELKDLFKKLKK